jgi:hypothetical protein
MRWKKRKWINSRNLVAQRVVSCLRKCAKTYMHLQFQKYFRLLYSRTPVKMEEAWVEREVGREGKGMEGKGERGRGKLRA